MSPAALPDVPVWSPAQLRLSALLALAPQAEVRERAAALYHHSTSQPPAALLPELRQLVKMVAEPAAAALGQAFGLSPLALLKFAGPNSSLSEIKGERAVLHRLDRLWGGAVTAAVEAHKSLRLQWPGPGSSQVVLIRGRAKIQRKSIRAFRRELLPPGGELRLARGGTLLKRSMLSSLLETAAGAGIHLGEDHPPGHDALELVVLGRRLTLRGSLATFGSRAVRLSGAEARVLDYLCRRRGEIATREALTLELGRAERRGLDRVMMQLRDKLGDGMVETVYGVGYRLNIDDEDGAGGAAPLTR